MIMFRKAIRRMLRSVFAKLRQATCNHKGGEGERYDKMVWSGQMHTVQTRCRTCGKTAVKTELVERRWG